MVDRAANDAVDGKEYLKRHGEVPVESQGMFTRPFNFHGTLHSDVVAVLGRLSTLLDASSRELVKSAEYYRVTDRAAAARIDALQPESKR